ncbi:hypothetical protein R69746_08505 [Paraburkholderia aspalathi]|uniref:plasmid pRiA4b ORF-3 family protein n=1 Tax=Paraburkholderia aspalathi TaxID=1324617 RepID=UPI001B0EDDAD|nr:plasmid pRiA4b ORF-3 family protein [Paraburkholderia aspalathi]CAE6872135.1 hypothetical protein R69746_08505 [Paraburkholderia aspalathi]
MVKKQAQIWTIKLRLREIKPVVWRRIEVPSTITLADLHQVIQTAMGWTNSHLHDFDLGDVRYGMALDDFDDGMTDDTGVRLDTICQPGGGFSQIPPAKPVAWFCEPLKGAKEPGAA